MRLQHAWAGCLALGLLLAPFVGFAAPPEVTTPIPTVSGGEEALPCQWPTVVTLAGCTGTLVHPRVVLTAAHCLLNGAPTVVRFGEQANAPTRTVDVDFCDFSPDYEWPNVDGLDYGACVLTEPVDDVPIVPVLMGCETDLLVLDQEAVIAGFGVAEVNGEAGTKHWAATRISTELAPDGSIEVGDFDAAGCPGDSGGPAFLQLSDGSWRVFGIVSGGPPCTFGADTYTTMHTHMPWFEEVTGEDLTPCHDAGGGWDPTPACRHFPLDPTEVGSWGEGCPGSLGDSGMSCGDPFDAVPDRDPPEVAIVAPADQTEYEDAPASFDVVVEADDGDGWGIHSVTLMVDGRDVAVLDEGPWTFPGVFPRGELSLEARAEDWAQNVRTSDPVVVYVGESASSDTGAETGDTTGGDTGGGSETTGSGEDGAASGADDAGCQCNAAVGSPGWLLLGLLALPVRRRRRIGNCG